MTTKELVRKLPLAEDINALRRARQVESRYRSVVKRYEQLPSPADFATLFARRSLFQRSKRGADWRVLFCGTDFLQDNGGFIQALSECCDLRLLYSADGRYGQALEHGSWEVNHEALGFCLSLADAHGWRPDIVLMQCMGSRFRAEDLQSLKQAYGFSIINIGMDERLAYRMGSWRDQELGIAGLNSVVDLALVTVPEAVEWYAKDGVPAKYFPLASNTDVYHPLPDVAKTHDVGFVGRAYGRRKQLARDVIRAGIGFEGRGPGWKSGSLDGESSNLFYNSCRIVLGMGQIGYSRHLMNPKLRDFEVPLSGALYVTNYTAELAALYVEDEEIVLYRDDHDLIDKLRYYSVHKDEAERVAANGCLRAKRCHQYRHRFTKLFNELLEGNTTAAF